MFLNLTGYFYLFTLEMKDNEKLMGNISDKGKSSNFAIFASTKYLLLQALLSSHGQTIDRDIVRIFQFYEDTLFWLSFGHHHSFGHLGLPHANAQRSTGPQITIRVMKVMSWLLSVLVHWPSLKANNIIIIATSLKKKLM